MSAYQIFDRNACEMFHPLPQEPQGPAWEVYCRYLSAKERRAIWEAANGPVPQGMRIGWTCKVAYCGKLHHMILAPNRNAGKCHYRIYALILERLKIGNSIDLPYPLDQGLRANFRCGLRAICGKIRFSFTSLPNGWIRLTRLQDWH